MKTHSRVRNGAGRQYEAAADSIPAGQVESAARNSHAIVLTQEGERPPLTIRKSHQSRRIHGVAER